MQCIAKADQLMDHSDSYIRIFNYLTDMQMEKKIIEAHSPMDMFLLDFFFFNKAEHFYMTINKCFKG